MGMDFDAVADADGAGGVFVVGHSRLLYCFIASVLIRSQILSFLRSIAILAYITVKNMIQLALNSAIMYIIYYSPPNFCG